jgi:Uma2 family endonuclease
MDNLHKNYTVEEYFELQKSSEIRHEFYYGKLIEMLGSSKKANKIALNILVKWMDKLEEEKHNIFNHNVITEIKPRNIYRYPDLVVAPESDDENEYVIKQPVIIVEVASETSWKTDSCAKLKEYTALPTLRYYLIVSQEEMFVQLSKRKGKDWTFEFFDQLEEVIEIPEYNLKISIAEIYKKVKFAGYKSDT